MKKFRIVEEVNGNGETKYYIEHKCWFWWSRLVVYRFFGVETRYWDTLKLAERTVEDELRAYQSHKVINRKVVKEIS